MRLATPLLVAVNGMVLFGHVMAWRLLDGSKDPTFTDSLDYTTTVSQRFSSYEIRVNRPKTCENVTQYSGYVDNIDRDDHTFFWFIESRLAPKTDPTVLWLNGGPGSSSMIGAWIEMGPCLVNKHGNETVVNPHSWNSAANVIFLDQPVNVGYSYGKSTVKTSAEAARNTYEVLQVFFETFSEYKNTSFHIVGESFGGHYAPALADEILQRHENIPTEEHFPKLESILLGNGWTDPKTQLEHFASYGCSSDNPYKPLFDEKTCRQMRDALPLCQRLMSMCYTWNTAAACLPAGWYCRQTQMSPLDKTGLSPLDIRKNCTGDNGYCVEKVDAIKRWANQEHVREQLGIDSKAGDFKPENDAVERRFALAGDLTNDYSSSIAKALDKGIRVLVYAGDMDWTCNWYGNKAWTLSIDWTGKHGYQNAKDEEWYNSDTGEHAGQIRSYLNFAFLRVFDAGHLVPYDQPANALDFFTKWVYKEPIKCD